MKGIPRRRPRASRGDARLGPENGPGRSQSAKNKATSAFAVALMLAAQQVGEDDHGRNGLVGYLSRIARTEPKLFFTWFIRAAMDQSVSEDEELQADVPYRTVEEAEEALLELGIDVRSLHGAAESGQERESRRAATASEKDEALEEVRRPVPPYSRTRRP
jgi:transcriptional regulator of met regulon